MTFAGRFQFRLRTVLIFTAFIATVAAWGSAKWRAAVREAEVVASLRSSGVRVHYEYQGDCYYMSHRQEDAKDVPPWLVQKGVKKELVSHATCLCISAGLNTLKSLQTCDFLALPELSSLVIHNEEVTDSDLVALKFMPSLQRLLLIDAKNVRGAGLRMLTRPQRLRDLNCSGASLNESGMKQISQFANLDSLNMDNQTISAEGMKELSSLKNLKSLSLNRSTIHKDGWPLVKNLEKLEYLSLNGSPVTESDLAYVASLPRLQWLELGYTRVGDVAAEHLTKCRRLEYLDLSATGITNLGLRRLTYLKSLKTLKLGHIKIDDEGARELMALPSIERIDLSNAAIVGNAGTDLKKVLGDRVSLPDS
ncbi:MAG: hypothetical protein K8T91_06265 [Planctomycetes bacterium]|nr:hypothetical protein [Planctomycetota bacterium]